MLQCAVPTFWADIGRAEQAPLRLHGGNGGRALDLAPMLDQPVATLQGAWGKEISENRRGAILRTLPEEDAADARSHWRIRGRVLPLSPLPGGQGDAR